MTCRRDDSAGPEDFSRPKDRAGIVRVAHPVKQHDAWAPCPGCAMIVEPPPIKRAHLQCRALMHRSRVQRDGEFTRVCKLRLDAISSNRFSELVGGVFYGGYPGGSGLTSGAVFGRSAGYGAAGK